MNNYQQQQQQSPALPPSLHATSQVSGYQQYGSSTTTMGTMGGNNLGTNTDGMVAYPTAHLYQQANSCFDWKDSDSYYSDFCGMGTAQMVPQAQPPPPGISDPVTKAVVDNILGKLPTKKIPVMHRCDVCEQEFSGKSVLDTHLAGAKHAKKLKSLEILQQLAATGQNFSQGGPSGNLRCEACGVDANSSQQLQTHLAGNKHKQRMMKLGGKMPPPPTPPTSLSSLMPPPPAPPPLKKPGTQMGLEQQQPTSANPAPPGTSAELPQRFYCEVCNVHLNSSLQMQQHVESRKHQDKECGKSQHSNKHHPYRRVPQARFQQSSKKKKKKQPIAFLTPLSSSFVPGSML